MKLTSKFTETKYLIKECIEIIYVKYQREVFSIKPKVLFAFWVIVLIIISPTTAVHGNDIGADTEIVVKSWKKGVETFNEQTFRLVLSHLSPNYEQIVTSKGGRSFKLFVVHNLYKSLSIEHWSVELREVFPSDNKVQVAIGSNLLRTQELLPGTHFYRKQDSIGVIYPEAKPIAFSESGEPMYGGVYDFYYFKTKRKILVEGFCVEIEVGDYEFNQKNPNKLDLLEVFVRFGENCESSKHSPRMDQNTELR